MFSELDTYNWAEVFAFAGEHTENCNHIKVVDTPPTSTASNATFKREDVKEIFLLIEGQNDENSWAGVFELHDGRYVWIHAGCCYTGWDVQAGGSAVGCTSLVEVVTMGMDSYYRKYAREHMSEKTHYALKDLLEEIQ